MSIKVSLYRELRFGLCGAGGVLENLVSPANVKQDRRNTPPSDRQESNYPYLLFRRVTASEDNDVDYARERIEIEAVGLFSSATVGDDRLEDIREALASHFSGRRRTIGQFRADGTPDAAEGVTVACNYVSTVEGFDEDYQEKAHIHIFIFHLLRP